MEFDVHITASLLRRVLVRRLLRGWLLLLLAVALIGTGLVMEVSRGPMSTVSVVAITAVGIYVFLYVTYYLRQRRVIAEWARLQGADPVHYTLSDESLRATSNLGVTELKWTVFQELREHPDFLLLGLNRHSHLTLPTAELPFDALAFIRQKFADLKLPVRKA